LLVVLFTLVIDIYEKSIAQGRSVHKKPSSRASTHRRHKTRQAGVQGRWADKAGGLARPTGQQGMQAWSMDGPTLTANIFAVATNRMCHFHPINSLVVTGNLWINLFIKI
jgi:hypothetical protein